MADLQRKQALRSAMENAQVQFYPLAAGNCRPSELTHISTSWGIQLQACRLCILATSKSYATSHGEKASFLPTKAACSCVLSAVQLWIFHIPMMQQAYSSFASCEKTLTR